MSDPDDQEDMVSEDEAPLEAMTPEKRARHAITGRGVTLQMLMADGIIEPGDGVLSLEYLGQKFTADLLSNGKIKSCETGKFFGTPSSWAIFCKKLVNPSKKSGCGWASVKYKGRKLDSWKTSWCYKKPQKPSYTNSETPVSEESSEDEQETSPHEDEGDNSVAQTTPLDSKPLSHLDSFDDALDLSTKPKTVPEVEKATTETSLAFTGEQEEALNLSLKSTPQPTNTTPKQQEIKPEPVDICSNDRKPVQHSCLPERSQNVDNNILVQSELFSALGKVQPFTVSMSTNSQLLLDFHCHLTTSEVVGYLGGKWDYTTQHLSIQQAFPCRCRLGDGGNAPLVEEEIRQLMKHLGMSLVGWYHSHPYCLPEPSVKDVDCQMAYQLRMKGSKSTYFPCIGIINSPYYDKADRTESSLKLYMVMPPPESVQSDYGIPMQLKFSVKQNKSVSEDLLSEMKKLIDFYHGSPDWISFQHTWHPGTTYLEKLKISLMNKLPEDQMNSGTFLSFVEHLLTQKR